MSDRRFVYTVMAIFLTVTSLIVAFNFWIDPLWHYDHAHAFNDVQVVVDEREQKTAHQYYFPPDDDTLLIGSSRVTYIHPDAFKKWDVYNYSVANLSIREVSTMMAFAFDQNPNYRRVVVGVDFFKSSTQEAGEPRSILNYEKKIHKPFYRTKDLMSFDVLDYSVENFILSAKNDISRDRLYDREGNAFAEKLSRDETLKQTDDKIDRFKETFYGESYSYYPKYKMILSKIHDTHPEAEKIVFTTPISNELFQAMLESGQKEDYKRWLRELVEVYGGIWNFMYPNTITNDITNYYDGHHFYPEIGDLIAARIEGDKDVAIPKDFGVYLTKDNVEEFLKQQGF